MNGLKNNWAKLVFILCVLIIVLLVVYYFYLSNKQNGKNGLVQQQLNSTLTSTSSAANVSGSDEASSTIAHTNQELCKIGAFTALLNHEIEYNQEIAKDRFVKYLRRAINDFLDNKYIDVNNSSCDGYTGLHKGRHCTDSAYGTTTSPMLSLENSNFLRSKFIVLATNIAPGGGESVVLMFKNKPDQMFYAWVYSDNEDYYDLRAFAEYGQEGYKPDILETQKIIINQLCNQEIGV